MRRLSVFVTAVTADLFGFSNGPAAGNAQPTLAPSLATINGGIPEDYSMGAGALPVNGLPQELGDPTTLVPLNTGAGAGPIAIMTTLANVLDAGAISNPAVAAPDSNMAPNVATGLDTNTIPDSAAGGIGSYLNQIAAELSGGTNTNNTGVPGALISPVDESSSTGSVSSTVSGTAAQSDSSLMSGETSAGVFPQDVSLSADATGVSIGTVRAPLEGADVLSGNPLSDELGSDGVTEMISSTFTDLSTSGTIDLIQSTSDVPLMSAMEGERRKESSVGTAAAAGGLMAVGAGACALYVRNRRSQPTELSRFGSPQRRSTGDMPRRFVPV